MDGFVAYVQHRILAETVHLVVTVLRSGLGQFSVKVDNTGAPCPLVKIIHILGNHLNIIIFLQGGYCNVGRIGLNLGKLSPPFIIKIQDHLPITVPALQCSDIFNTMVFP